MSAASLKPCPFCGGTVDLSYADGLWRAECDVCGVSTPGQPDYEEVFRLWNGREVTDEMIDKAYGVLRGRTLLGRWTVCRQAVADALGAALGDGWWSR